MNAIATESYRLPSVLEPELARVRSYWEGLKRGANDIPYWDDVKISARTHLGHETMIIGVFENPLRYRFDVIGDAITKLYGEAISGKFADEIDLRQPLDEISSQCQVTIGSGAPTYYSRPRDTEHHGYARVIFPLWGNGRIEMLLAAVTTSRALGA